MHARIVAVALAILTILGLPTHATGLDVFALGVGAGVAQCLASCD